LQAHATPGVALALNTVVRDRQAIAGLVAEDARALGGIAKTTGLDDVTGDIGTIDVRDSDAAGSETGSDEAGDVEEAADQVAGDRAAQYPVRRIGACDHYSRHLRRGSDIRVSGGRLDVVAGDHDVLDDVGGD